LEEAVIDYSSARGRGIGVRDCGQRRETLASACGIGAVLVSEVSLVPSGSD